jgi:phosphate starvation-inducible membrane PsiE
VVRAIETTEDVIHVVVGILLAVLGIVLVFDTVRKVATVLNAPDLQVVVLAILEQTLLLFIVAELLHTVAIAVSHRGALDPVPFLVVGLVAAIRSVLILTAEAEQSFRWNPEGIQLLILMALILVMAITAVVWRHSSRLDPAQPQTAPPSGMGKGTE